MGDEILEYFNKLIREEKGNRLSIDSRWKDADVDSFGTVIVFMEMDTKYGYFTKAGLGDNPFKEIPYDTITAREIVETCLLENTTI